MIVAETWDFKVVISKGAMDNVEFDGHDWSWVVALLVVNRTSSISNVVTTLVKCPNDDANIVETVAIGLLRSHSQTYDVVPSLLVQGVLFFRQTASDPSTVAIFSVLINVDQDTGQIILARWNSRDEKYCFRLVRMQDYAQISAPVVDAFPICT